MLWTDIRLGARWPAFMQTERRRWPGIAFGDVADSTQYNRLPRFYSRSHGTVIRVCDDADNVMEAHVQAGDFKAFKLKGDGECSRQQSEV
jgi:hypothetical protein